MTAIEEALALEELDRDLYRSITLWRPYNARAVFGGQVVGQALAAASKTVPEEFVVHSFHSYFLLPGDAERPIIYQVSRVREGKSFATRTVYAKQQGQHIFTCMCSFQKPEAAPNGFSHTKAAPTAPDPENLANYRTLYETWIASDKSGKYRDTLKDRLKDPMPIDMRPVRTPTLEQVLHPPKREAKQHVWMRATGKLSDKKWLHRCVLAYASDHLLLTTSLLPVGVNSFSKPSRVKMMASLDHSVYFHDDFRADEWLLYVMESPWLDYNRGFCLGRIFTKEGKLVASIVQEGVIRTGMSSLL